MKIFFFALLILPMSILAEGGLPNQPYIYVEGKAEVQKPADMATLRFDIVSRAPDQPKANEHVQADANKVFALLKDRKIADSDIIAENLRSEPEFEQEENYRAHGKLIDYKVTRPFQVKIRDIAALPKLVDDIIALGEIEFSGIDGGLSKEKEAQDELWQKALTNARERADKTSKTMGMKLDSVFAVSPVTFPEVENSFFGDVGAVAGARSADLRERAAEPQYRLGEIKLTQEVHVIYLISPAK